MDTTIGAHACWPRVPAILASDGNETATDKMPSSTSAPSENCQILDRPFHDPFKLEQNSREYQDHIRKVAQNTKLWVIATDAVLGTVQGGAWKGRMHSGCSMVARPDGTAATVGKFKEPDFIIFDIPAGNSR